VKEDRCKSFATVVRGDDIETSFDQFGLHDNFEIAFIHLPLAILAQVEFATKIWRRAMRHQSFLL
jgi:hypothetical protein